MIVGTAVGAIAGATAGAIKARTNDTKNDREAFAKSLGLANSSDLWARLNETLPPEQAAELQHRALNRIGKHDNTANTQWMADVKSAMGGGGAPTLGSIGAPPGAPAPAAAFVTLQAPDGTTKQFNSSEAQRVMQQAKLAGHDLRMVN